MWWTSHTWNSCNILQVHTQVRSSPEKEKYIDYIVYILLCVQGSKSQAPVRFTWNLGPRRSCIWKADMLQLSCTVKSKFIEEFEHCWHLISSDAITNIHAGPFFQAKCSQVLWCVCQSDSVSDGQSLLSHDLEQNVFRQRIKEVFIMLQDTSSVKSSAFTPKYEVGASSKSSWSSKFLYYMMLFTT